MSKLFIRGEKPLFGQIEIPTSKNAFLPILAGCVLCEGEVVLKNNPNYSDIANMCDLLTEMGAKIHSCGNNLHVRCDFLNECAKTDPKKSALLRSSFFLLGALLARFKKATVAYPGGCVIGARPIDIHISSLKKMGAEIYERHGFVVCDGKNLHGEVLELPFPSVGATENIILCAVLTKGTTIIRNYAKEPEVFCLADFLTECGAKITIKAEEIEIIGVEKLSGCIFAPIKDRIVAGTFVLATAMCGGNVTLLGTQEQHLSSLLTKIASDSCKITCTRDKINIASSGLPKPIKRLCTQPYPGFPTDLQNQTLAYLTLAKGTSMIVENIFENRFGVAGELRKMGADITESGKVCVVCGVKELMGADVEARDLRGGASLILAGLCAKGYTTISGVNYIDRGYKNIENDFASLGADIQRID